MAVISTDFCRSFGWVRFKLMVFRWYGTGFLIHIEFQSLLNRIQIINLFSTNYRLFFDWYRISVRNWRRETDFAVLISILEVAFLFLKLSFLCHFFYFCMLYMLSFLDAFQWQIFLKGFLFFLKYSVVSLIIFLHLGLDFGNRYEGGYLRWCWGFSRDKTIAVKTWHDCLENNIYIYRY